MVILTIRETKNSFINYFEYPIQNISKIALLGIVINFKTDSIPENIFLYCNEIKSDRLYNGKKSYLLDIINKRKVNQISFNINERKYIKLQKHSLEMLTILLKDSNNNLINNIDSVYIDFEII